MLLKGLVDTNRFGEIVIDERGRTSAAGITLRVTSRRFRSNRS